MMEHINMNSGDDIINGKNQKISIITISLNTEEIIGATIESVINQTYNNIEYIIIDGASTDNTIDIIKEYESKISFWLSESDDGIYDAMNKAVRFVTGEWIIFMNAGDTFYNNNVCERFNGFIKDDVDIYYGDVCIDGEKVINSPRKIYPFFFRMERMINHQTIFARSRLFKIKQFDTRYRVVADREWLFFFKRKGYKISHISLIVCIYDSHGVSSNTEKFKRDSFKLIKESYGNLGLIFVICKRFIGKVVRLLGLLK
jgi:glycosyltransferase involved in cell wall biosynthesis